MNEIPLGTWIDGVAADVLPADDRGLHYGDGLFETILVRNGRPRFLEVHLARLARGCTQLGIAFEAMSELRRDTAMVAGRAPPLAVLKIIVTRGSAQRRGYAAGGETARRIVTLWPASDAQVPDRCQLRVARLRLSQNPALAGIKHLNRLENVLAASEPGSETVFDSLLLDASGDVVGGTKTNVFVAGRGRLATPFVDRSGVAGVLRAVVLRECAVLGVPVEERRLTLAEVFDADEVFVTNARIGVVPVTRLGEHVFRMNALGLRIKTHIEALDA